VAGGSPGSRGGARWHPWLACGRGGEVVGKSQGGRGRLALLCPGWRGGGGEQGQAGCHDSSRKWPSSTRTQRYDEDYL
jgi:hypothetical protein